MHSPEGGWCRSSERGLSAVVTATALAAVTRLDYCLIAVCALRRAADAGLTRAALVPWSLRPHWLLSALNCFRLLPPVPIVELTRSWAPPSAPGVAFGSQPWIISGCCCRLSAVELLPALDVASARSCIGGAFGSWRCLRLSESPSARRALELPRPWSRLRPLWCCLGLGAASTLEFPLDLGAALALELPLALGVASALALYLGGALALELPRPWSCLRLLASPRPGAAPAFELPSALGVASALELLWSCLRRLELP